MAQRKVYYIPDNFVDDEKIFGGKFRKRNFIEAVIFTLPVLGLFWLINWATGIGWGTLFYPTFLFGIATFFLFIIGYNGDSWGETLLLAQKFRSNKFNISTYNPRIKTELTADYLANPNANSKAEAMYNGLCVAMDRIYKKSQELGGNCTPIIFVLTDGDSNTGYKFSETKDIIAGMNIPIYTISYNYAADSLSELASINEAASIVGNSEDITYKLRNLFNAEM